MNDATVRLVVIILGVLAGIIVTGCVVIAVLGNDIPGALIGLGGTVVGALAGILSNTAAGGDTTPPAVRE